MTDDSDNDEYGSNPDKGACNAPLQNLQTDIVALETENEQLIYALYCLTEEEIALVEGRR